MTGHSIVDIECAIFSVIKGVTYHSSMLSPMNYLLNEGTINLFKYLNAVKRVRNWN